MKEGRPPPKRKSLPKENIYHTRRFPTDKNRECKKVGSTQNGSAIKREDEIRSSN